MVAVYSQKVLVPVSVSVWSPSSSNDGLYPGESRPNAPEASASASPSKVSWTVCRFPLLILPPLLMNRAFFASRTHTERLAIPFKSNAAPSATSTRWLAFGVSAVLKAYGSPSAIVTPDTLRVPGLTVYTLFEPLLKGTATALAPFLTTGPSPE